MMFKLFFPLKFKKNINCNCSSSGDCISNITVTSKIFNCFLIDLLNVSARFSFGKNSFLTGFGLGFLAFGLKKLLLPLFIGVQIVKSVLIAMFLPSILGGIGKLVGKGVSNFASSSGSSSPSNVGGDNLNDFDFKVS